MSARQPPSVGICKACARILALPVLGPVVQTEQLVGLEGRGIISCERDFGHVTSFGHLLL